jgi:hypothetical protein
MALCGSLSLAAVSPTFTSNSQPRDQVLAQGYGASWSVVVISTQPVAHQWWKDGAPLPGATNRSLSLTNVAFTDTGNYWLTGTNSLGAATSRVARVTVTPRAELRRIGRIRVNGIVLTTAIVGSTAYVGVTDSLTGGPARNAGLELWDVADPIAPRLLGAYRLPAANHPRFFSDVAVVDHLAYLAVDLRIEVVDVSNPAQPVPLGEVPVSDGAFDLVVRGPLLFLGTSRGIQIYDRSAAMPLPRVGQFLVHHPVYSIVLSGDTLFCAGPSFSIANQQGLRAIDVSHPETPLLLGTLKTPNFNPDTVRVRGDRAYLVGYGEGPMVYDMGHPGFPRRLDTALNAVLSNGMDVVGDLVLTGDWKTGSPRPATASQLAVFDAVDPSTPFRIGEVTTSGQVEAVEYADGRIYIAASEGGVDILELVPAVDPPVILAPVKPVAAVAGTAAELAVAASGGGFLNHQWSRDGQPIVGATNRTLRLASVTSADEALYSVVVGNAQGRVSGGEAWLSVIGVPGLSLNSVQLGASRGPKLAISSTPGVQGELHGSADLQNWQPLWYGSFGDLPLELYDTYASNRLARAYRLNLGAR